MKNEISWSAPSRIFIKKSVDWYWIVGIIATTIAIIAIILDNIIFALLTIITVMVVFLNAHKEPKTVTIIINKKGVKIDEKIYFYDELESFWIEENNLHPRILLKSKHTILKIVTILIHEDDTDEARDFLSEHMKEEYMNENIIEKILIYFGF